MPRPKQNKSESRKSKDNNNDSSKPNQNRAKKRKINKPVLDGIAMSKQLQMKKKDQSINRAKRQKKNINRICPNGKPMPSLSELELLFEDSDEDGDENHAVTNIPARPSTPDIPVINPDLILSPTTYNRITAQVKEILANNLVSNVYKSQDNEIPSVNKLLNFDNKENVIYSTENVLINPDHETGHQEKKNDQNYQPKTLECLIETKPNKNEQGSEPIMNDIINSDSDDTVEYNFSPFRIHTSVLETFTPLPSTSKDNQTFIKNDELFNQSLQAVAAINNEPKQDYAELKLHKTPPEIITSDDIIKIEETDDKIVVIVSDNPSNSTDAKDSNDKQYVYEDDDDDCIIVETKVNTKSHNVDHTEIIDINYPLPAENNNTKSFDYQEDEIIDIDALIAQNQTVLDKLSQYQSKKSDTINLIVDVDTSTIVENSSAQNCKPSNNNSNPKNDSNLDCELLDISDMPTGTSNKIQNLESQTNTNILQINSCNIDQTNIASNGNPSNSNAEQITHEVNNFFNHHYKPPHNLLRDNTLQSTLTLPQVNLNNNTDVRIVDIPTYNTGLSPRKNKRTPKRRNEDVPEVIEIVSEDPNSRSVLETRNSPVNRPKKTKTIPSYELITENNNTQLPSPQKTPGTLDIIYVDPPTLSKNKAVEESNDEEIKLQPKISGLYTELVQLEQQALVLNTENFECGVCMDEYSPGCGVVLHECMHIFCKECLTDVARHCEESDIPCPAMGCQGVLQEREIRSLLSPPDFERWLSRGLATAESSTRNAFHCRTTDCKGWALCEPEVKIFPCPVCKLSNCIPCQAIHPGNTCEQYCRKLTEEAGMKNIETRVADEKTRKLLSTWMTKGTALACPECSAIITKKSGCDWIKCSACKTEICWVTRGRRWGPGGVGDTSGGCRCRVNRKKCHPSCTGCH